VAQAAPQPVPTTRRAERTRQRILVAAGECFAAQGFSRATVEAIAAGAGVSKGIVYRHFRGKELILEALLERTLAEWSRVSGIREQVARSGSVLAGLEGSLRGSLAYARSHPLVRALFHPGRAPDPLAVLGVASSAAVQRCIADGRAELVEALRAGIASGELRADLDPERAADLVRLISTAFVERLLDPRWIDASDEALVATGLDVLRRGLRAEARP
jgi:TetR/AcrR family acrAB operon transcriptional repressor